MRLQRRGKEEEEALVLYFDSWPKEERCIILPLKQVCYMSSLKDHIVLRKKIIARSTLQAMVVRGVKPALVSLYDYYDKNEK